MSRVVATVTGTLGDEHHGQDQGHGTADPRARCSGDRLGQRHETDRRQDETRLAGDEPQALWSEGVFERPARLVEDRHRPRHDPPGDQQKTALDRTRKPATGRAVRTRAVRLAQEQQGDPGADDRQRQDQPELDRVVPEPDPDREQIRRRLDREAAVPRDGPGQPHEPRRRPAAPRRARSARARRARPSSGSGRARRGPRPAWRRAIGIGSRSWTWISAQTPSSAPATSAQATQRRPPSVARRNARIANGRIPNTRSRG